MADETKCPHCGKPVPSTALGGICPECMLQAGLASHTEGPTGARVVLPPPKPADIAALFPQLEILECLGRGGMGVVYKARQPQLDRMVALKILARDREQNGQFPERFAREAQALARLNHPNIVAVHDFGQSGGFHYFIMEYVDGANLRQVERAGKMPARQALNIITRICDALQFAHDQGVVHRDIKPENILLDKQGRVKIADFGIAKLLGAENRVEPLTGERHVIGTPHYMAPEQVEKPQEVDHRADIYSLGVVFYELLTGELPLGRFAAPSRMRGLQVDVRLDEVVLRALEKEPAMRYQQASQLKTQVETIATTPGAPPGPARASFSGRGRNYQSAQSIFGLPLLHVTSGIDPATGRPRLARGIVAVGPVARGFVAVGYEAMGVFPVGLLAWGVAPVGLLALGFFSAGVVAVGVEAAGVLAFGTEEASGVRSLLLRRGVTAAVCLGALLIAWLMRWAIRTVERGVDQDAGVADQASPDSATAAVPPRRNPARAIGLLLTGGVAFVGLVTLVAFLVWNYRGDKTGAAGGDQPKPPTKTIVLTRPAVQPVGTSNDTRTVTVWTDSTLFPGETMQSRVRLPDGRVENANGGLFVSATPEKVSTSCSFSWFFSGGFGEDEANTALAQIQAYRTERPIALASGEPLELFIVTNRFGGVMAGSIEFIHTDPQPPDASGHVRVSVRIERVAGYLPSLDYSAKVPAGYVLRGTANSGQTATHSPHGPSGYNTTWFAAHRYPSSPELARRWPEQQQARQSALEMQLRQLQEQGTIEIIAGEPRRLFSLTNSPGDVFEGYLELVGPDTPPTAWPLAPDHASLPPMAQPTPSLPIRSIRAPVVAPIAAPVATNPPAEKLNEDQRLVLEWTDRQFRSFFDPRSFDSWSEPERTALETKLIDLLKGRQTREYYEAINTLAAMRSIQALPLLRQIAFDREDKDCRDRWMSVRALGIIGDRGAVPDLIQLVYHGNVNTHWWAQISLVRLTGQNFGGDWNAWGEWWNRQNGQPPYKPDIIRWWNGQAEPDKLAESIAEADRKFLGNLRPKSQPAQ